MRGIISVVVFLAMFCPASSMAGENSTSLMARLETLTTISKPKNMTARPTIIAGADCPDGVNSMPSGCRCDGTAECLSLCCQAKYRCDGDGRCVCAGSCD